MADRELSNALASGELSSIQLGGVTTAEKVLKKSEIDAVYETIVNVDAIDTRVTAVESPTSIAFTPTTTPSHVEGTAYYNAAKEEFRLQGPYTGVEVAVGHGMHTHVVNNTASIITKGTACRHNGVAAGVVQVVPAQADSFTNADIFGVATADIAIGANGAITTFGEIEDVDTSGVPSGVPLYLSDTVAGTWTATPPNIVSQVGGALTQDAVTGRLFVSIQNNRNIPTVFAGMQGKTVPLVSATTTVQDITGYVSKTENVSTADITTGVITVSNNGEYRLHFTADITFPSSISTRTVFIELYDATNTSIIYTYTKNIPRDATDDGFSFSWPFPALASDQFKMRIRSSVAIGVTFNDLSFDITSVTITN